MTSSSNDDDLPSVHDENMQVHNVNLEERFDSGRDGVLREQRHQSFIEQEKDLNIYRSGSAPQAVDARNYDPRDIDANRSNNNGVFSEDAMLSHPAHLSYYYSNENNIPRLPPPFLSKEDWRATQRFQAEGSPIGVIGDRRKRLVDDGSSSLLCVQPTLFVQQHGKSLIDLTDSSGRNLSRQSSSDWQDRSSDSLISISSNRLGGLRKSLADILQEGLDQPCSVPGQLPTPSSRNAFGDSVGGDDSKISDLSNVPGTDLQDETAAFSLLGLQQSHGRPIPQEFAAAVGWSSLSRSSTRHEAQLIGMAPSPSLPPVGSRVYTAEKKTCFYIQDEEGHVQPQLAGCSLDGSGKGKGHMHSGLQSPFVQPSYSKFFPGTYEFPSYGGSISRVRDYPDIPYLGELMANNRLSSIGPGAPNPMLQNERMLHYNSMTRNSMGGSIGLWPSDVGNGKYMAGRLGSSLLDEFRSNKSKSFELSDIVNHVVEFSMDQYGSRFIQQKLETAKLEEKNQVFPEIIPHARDLMTDVFGNYVIQKLFERGTENQIKELACQLTGHVLFLSLQKYGCRVIQKALEVVDADQQTRMAAELDGAVMKCVQDQNGNHVIQKCIKCVPQDRIQFVISAFYGQVVPLSTHPYGCRVIQRVLEHCDDLNTQRFIMDEIMQSVCSLSQDQYGNYVIQHVLEHGQPLVRSAVITKLAGQIINMSRHKFASNVVEKCLTFGSHEERQILVKEMLGSTDENEPLQLMMKDQFGNYVVQKVLETCDDQNLELILSRIRAHFNTLKKYTYGAHVVARVEKLITTGEKRIQMASSAHSQGIKPN